MIYRQVQNGIKETVKTLEDHKEQIIKDIGTIQTYQKKLDNKYDALKVKFLKEGEESEKKYNLDTYTFKTPISIKQVSEKQKKIDSINLAQLKELVNISKDVPLNKNLTLDNQS